MFAAAWSPYFFRQPYNARHYSTTPAEKVDPPARIDNVYVARVCAVDNNKDALCRSSL